MTADQYVQAVLAKYEVARGPNSPAESLGNRVAGPLRSWANQFLDNLQYTGSYAKQTGVRGISDIDIFISLKSNRPGTLKEVYQSLYSFAQQMGWSPRQQNVSIGITVDGTRGDLVPGRIQPSYQNYHSLYRRKTDSWTQTNVTLHVDTVRNSGRVSEIRALKIWRLLNSIDFPSLYLELFIIRALSGRSKNSIADNVLYALRGVGTSLLTTRIEDPANTNNVLSDELTNAEKQRIQSVALRSSQEQYWSKIIW